MIEFEPVNEDNLAQYREYESVFENDLRNYQSRIYPDKTAHLCWYHIKSEGKYIGAIWLELKDDVDYAVLGIFVADREFRNKGIGTAAIRWIIRHDLPQMGVDQVLLRVRSENTRAIVCYEKVGFCETRRYQKGEISVIEMIYKINR